MRLRGASRRVGAASGKRAGMGDRNVDTRCGHRSKGEQVRPDRAEKVRKSGGHGSERGDGGARVDERVRSRKGYRNVSGWMGARLAS